MLHSSGVETSRAPVSAALPARIPIDQAALFFDLDGTLVRFADDPEAVRADAACLAMLATARSRLDDRVAILSGRTVESVDRVLAAAAACVAGVHGLQHRAVEGSVTAEPPHAALEGVADSLQMLAAAQPGLRVERKGLSVAIHYRLAPQAGEAVVEAAERLAAASGLLVQHGVMVAELRPPGAHKGHALRRFMSRAPFAGATPIFIGDDLTDEVGFAAAQALGGQGILVGRRRSTAANHRLADPEAVRGWINDSLVAGAFDLGATEWAA